MFAFRNAARMQQDGRTPPQPTRLLGLLVLSMPPPGATGIIGPRRHWRPACRRAPGWEAPGIFAALAAAWDGHVGQPRPGRPSSGLGRRPSLPRVRTGRSSGWPLWKFARMGESQKKKQRRCALGRWVVLCQCAVPAGWNSCWLCCDPRASPVHAPPTGKSSGDALIVAGYLVSEVLQLLSAAC